MQFENEDAIQLFISQSLTQMGVANEREVMTNNGARIDILSKEYAIEVKPKLNRAALYQAAGQMLVYTDSFPGREYILAGLMPSGESAAKSAVNAAKRLKEKGMKIWFINEMPEFQKLYYGEEAAPVIDAPMPAFSFRLKAGAIAVALIGLLAMCSQGKNNVSPIAQASSPQTAMVTPPPDHGVYLRSEPSQYSEALETMMYGTKLSVLGEVREDGWVLVQRGEVQGWVYFENITRD